MKNALFLAIGLFLLCTSCTDRTKAINFHVRGKKAFNKMQYEKALPLFNNALELDPDFQDAHAYKRWTLENLEMWEKVIAEYDYEIDRKIAANDTTYIYAINGNGTQWESMADLYFNRAEAKRNLGFEQEALKDYTLTLQAIPDHITALCERGFIYYKNQDYKSAITDLKVAADYGMDRAEYDLANTYYKLDSIDAACRYWYKSENFQITEQHNEMGLKTAADYYKEICIDFYELD